MFVGHYGPSFAIKSLQPRIGLWMLFVAEQLAFWKAQNGIQGGDPAKLARALMTIIDQAPPPLRFTAGSDAIATAEQVVAALQQQIDAFRDLSKSLAFDEVGGAANGS